MPKLTSRVAVLAGANVGKVRLSSDTTPRATGVEFQDQSSVTYTVSARLEVLVATGSIKTPGMSFIFSLIHKTYGFPSYPAALWHWTILRSQCSWNHPASQSPHRAEPHRPNNDIDRLAVPERERWWPGESSQMSEGAFAHEVAQPILFPRFQDLVSGSDAKNMTSMLQNNLSTYAQDAVSAGAASNATALQTILAIQADWILNKGAAFSESFDYTYTCVPRHSSLFSANGSTLVGLSTHWATTHGIFCLLAADMYLSKTRTRTAATSRSIRAFS
jgi:hypothetical protein